MIIKKKYKDINDTLRHIKIQIVDGTDYALSKCPAFKDPEELFYWLKNKTRYKSDPKNVELLQTLPTLLNGEFWGYPGGDCDCLTISTITLMIAQNWKNISIVLVGRDKSNPVHIYTIIKWKGQRKVLDLTNKDYNKERTYPYIQELPVNWENW
jgi:hypothetical protein